MKVINDWMVSCGMKKDIKVLKDPITNKPIQPVTFADAVYLNNGTRLEDNLRYLLDKVSVIGNSSKLETSNKNTLVDALNEVVTNKRMYNEYGVMFSGSNPIGERLGSAEDLYAHAYYGSGTRPRNDFDTIYPWSDIKRCIIGDDGTIWSYEGEPGFTLSPEYGNIFVEIPRFYQKISYDAERDILELWISANPRDGYELSPAFLNGTNELPFIYIGAYELTNDGEKLCSKSGQSVSEESKLTLEEMKDMLKHKSSNFKLIDIHERNILELLFCIEYATLNSQNIFKGKNIIDSEFGLRTGETDFNSEYPSCTLIDSHEHSFRYRYMENLWGNMGEIIDGVIVDNYTVKIMDKEVYSYSTADITGSFINERTLEGIPTLSDKQSANNFYFCDYISLPKDGKQKSYVVGHPHVLNIENQEISSLGNGLFSVSMDFNIDKADKFVTSRLVYKPQK